MEIILYVIIQQRMVLTDTLAVMESNDGREYYNMKALIPEIPPYKYQGNIKNLGTIYAWNMFI